MALTDVDVAIIGAGPAGGAAALDLTRAGRRVILIERHQFPREKVCGGCLSGRAVGYLRALVGAAHPLIGIPGRQVSFIDGSYRVSRDSHGQTQVVVRPELDAWLADLAAAAGAELRFGEAAKLVRGNRGWDVLVGDTHVRAAGMILLASGLNTLPNGLGIEGVPQRRRLIAQQWTQPHVPGLPELGCLELHWFRGGYVGLATPVPGRTVAAIAAETPGLPGESAFARLRRLNPHAPLWSVLEADAPRRFNARGVAGFPWAPTKLGADNVLLLGDLAGYEEPFTGEGMAQALGTAASAARAILEGGDILARYTELLRECHQPAGLRVRRLQRVLGNPVLQFLAHRPVFLPRRALSHLVGWVHIRATA